MKKIFLSLLVILMLSACGKTTPVPPTQYPDTPTPNVVNAPVVESPALISIHMLDEAYGWGVTETQIVRTNDGGVTWYNVTPQGIAEVGYKADTFFLDVNHGWVLFPDEFDPMNKGLLYRTSDGGMNWDNASMPFGRADMTFLDASNAWALVDRGVGAGSNAVAVYQSTDGGSNWTMNYTNDPTQPNAGDSLPLGGLKSFLTPRDMQTAWVGGVVYSEGTVYLYRSDDSGKTWSQLSLSLPAEAQTSQLTFEQMTFVSPNDAFFVMRIPADTSREAVYVSHDRGETWALTPTLIPQGGSADFISAAEAVIFNGEQFYVTKDAAQTWTIIPPDVVFGDSFSGMDFVNSSTGWVIATDPANHHSLYKTTDGGATWTPIVP
jgi:photosystem II stability/assembly factor-like uncharacterized protein